MKPQSGPGKFLVKLYKQISYGDVLRHDPLLQQVLVLVAGPGQMLVLEPVDGASYTAAVGFSAALVHSSGFGRDAPQAVEDNSLW